MNAGEGIQIGVAVVLMLTLGAVLWYAWEARKQAKASARVAEAALRPVMVLWADPWAPHDLPGAEVSYNVRYKNIGNGPALNIRFCLGFVDGRWLEQDTRVSMGVGDEESPLGVKVPLPIPDQLFVTAEYEDASHSRWKTTITLQKDGVFMRNRESKLERLLGG